MDYNAISLILSLSTIHPVYQEIVFIKQLNNFFGFDHNIVLLHASVDTNRFINTTELQTKTEYVPQTFYRFKKFDDHIIGLETLTEIKSKNTLLILVPENSSFNANLNLYIRIKKIQLLNVNTKIGVFFQYPVSSDDILKLFQWCWSNRIINIFVAFNSNSSNSLNIFNFNPFGTFNVINVTSHESEEKVFPSQLLNFQQYELQILKQVKGGSFTFDYSAKNPKTMGGPNGKLWHAIIRALNASFTVHVATSKAELRRVERNTIDIYPELSRIKEQQQLTLYPMAKESFIIFVPEAVAYSEFSAYLQTIMTDSFFAYSLVVIGVVMFLLIVFRYIKLRKILVFQCAADILNLVIFNDNGAIKYAKLSRTEVCLLVPLTFAGFVFVNGILSTLQSYLTKPVIQSQINTIDDIYMSPYPIVINGEYWETSTVVNILQDVSTHRGWSDKIRVVDTIEMQRGVFSYNRSISLLYLEEQARILLERQKRLNIKGYHIPTQTNLHSVLTSYNVNRDFPFMERLNNIMHLIRDAGLFEKLTTDGYRVLVQKRTMEYGLYVGRTPPERDIDRFPIPVFIGYGWIAGIIVLAIEIIYVKFITNCQQKFQFYVPKFYSSK